MPYHTDQQEQRLLADDIILFPTAQGTRYAVTVAGDFGGGSFLIQHLNNEVPILYEDGTFTDDGGLWIFATSDFTRFQLAGATDPDITVRIVQLKR